MSDTDLSAIRSRYLGVDKKKRKIRKMNHRKFVFDWDTQDDTAADMPAPPVVPGQGVAQVMLVADILLGWMITTAHRGRELSYNSQIQWREDVLLSTVLTRGIGLISHSMK